ncbi:MAG: hypothetical protein M3O82_03440, partial [Verrucomicrobiota bacterium]|nr:hypothetical protein [Verrucomicrobiota bacterium]
DAIDGYKRAELVDPRNPVMLYDASQTYYLLRDWKGAADAMDLALALALALAPESITIKIQRAYVPFFSTGTTAAIKAALATIPADTDPDGTVTYAHWDVSLIDRDFDAARKAVAACRVDTITTPDGAPLPKIYLQAYIALMQGNEAEAQAGFETALPALEKTVRESSDDPARHAHLGLLYALMGRKEDALREGRRAVDLKPISTDAIDGAIMETFLALIYARVGMPDDAIPLLERILTRPSGVNYPVIA